MHRKILLAVMSMAWLFPAHAVDMPAQASLAHASAPASDARVASGEDAHPRALLSGLLKEIRAGMPPLEDLTILPVVKKVYPTGAKPLVIVSFKCPTELIGIAPPTVKLLHGLVDLGANGLNKSNLLSFDIQQVCS